MAAVAAREALFAEYAPHPSAPIPEDVPDDFTADQRAAIERAWNEASRESRELSLKLRQIDRVWLSVHMEVARGRDEQDRSNRLPFGESAMEKLCALRADFAEMCMRCVPTPEQYKKWLLTRFAPAYNAISSYDRYCIECGTLFAIADARAKGSQRCSTECRKAHDMRKQRERDARRARRRVSDEETARAKMDHHHKNCTTCKRRLSCNEHRRLFEAFRRLAEKSR